MPLLDDNRAGCKPRHRRPGEHSWSTPHALLDTHAPDMPKVLILGSTGGCGSQALLKMLQKGTSVTAIVRSEDRLPVGAKGHKRLTTVVAPNGHLALSDAEFVEHLRGCDAVISSLGHNLTFKGIYGAPRMLCTDSVLQICRTAEQLKPKTPIRLIVMNTEGVDRLDGADPQRKVGERLLLGLLWLLLPPMTDNVRVMQALHTEARANPHVEFCGVRPSDMIDGEPSAYTVHATLQNGIFNAGKSTRANVGAFMAELATETSTWKQWKNAFPHILDDPEVEK